MVSVIDETVYADLRDTTGAEFLGELIDTFVEEGPKMLQDLHAALAEADVERFRRAAHSLKSNSKTFGAVKVALLARELELQGLNADVTRVPAALAVLEAEYACAAAQLKTMRNG